MGVETSCFGGAFLQSWQDNCTVLRGGWMGPCIARFWPTTSFPQGAETPCFPATAPKPERSGEDLYGGVGQNPCCSVCKPGQELQETSDLCNCKQRFLYQILSSIFLLYQIHIACNTFSFQILSLTVEVYLWWKLQISPFFASGKPWKIGNVSNTYLSHYIYLFNYY